MNLWKSMDGMLEATLTGADPDKTLRIINEQGIHLYQLQWVDELTVKFRCARRNRHVIRLICKKRGYSVSFRDDPSIFRSFTRFFHRPILAAELVLLFLLTVCLPSRVLFFRVEGNVRIPEQQILEAAQQCGIRFGVSRRRVRSEQMKNALLSAMPELQWAGINTAGCSAVISVRERQQEVKKEKLSGISHIVAVRDGYVTECTVTQGSAMCAPGQIVQEGQILISGFTDCGICVQVSDAAGEIFAQTDRKFRGWMPATREIRQKMTETSRRYSLIFGKKRINLWKGSGISTATCGRMYEEYSITLPGGHQLPIRLSVETLTDSTIIVEPVAEEDVQAHLMAFARTSVLAQTVSGVILREEQKIVGQNGRFELDSRFWCQEMIGRVITEEIGEANGKND